MYHVYMYTEMRSREKYKGMLTIRVVEIRARRDMLSKHTQDTLSSLSIARVILL